IILQKLINSSLNLFQDSTKSQEIINPYPSLLLLRQNYISDFKLELYKPVICLILQGAKETTVEDLSIQFEAGQMLIVSHDIPVVSRIVKASPSKPYIAMILSLNIEVLRSLFEEVGEHIDWKSKDTPMVLKEQVEEETLLCFERYLTIMKSSLETKVIEPMLYREIHFRILMSPSAFMLQRLLRFDSNASRILVAIHEFRKNFKRPIAIPRIAEKIGMGVSSFHSHFKNITQKTPLQYQKDLRLIEANQLLREGKQSVTEIALLVGYESPNQFSREYKKKFGITPKSDLPN
ncbi:MAG: AraC family transcriptional regulator, partial [Spirochaetota bacterium]